MEELLEINNVTGEIIVPCNKVDKELIKTSKIKALQLLNPNDFVNINGVWEAKRDALIKILSSLPINYAWEIKDKELTNSYASITGVLTVTTGSISRQSDSIGICEMNELKTTKSLHFMITRAETRALKRAIEVLFGSVINYYVVNYLVLK
jgi:hypothetical protein